METQFVSTGVCVDFENHRPRSFIIKFVKLSGQHSRKSLPDVNCAALAPGCRSFSFLYSTSWRGLPTVFGIHLAHFPGHVNSFCLLHEEVHAWRPFQNLTADDYLNLDIQTFTRSVRDKAWSTYKLSLQIKSIPIEVRHTTVGYLTYPTVTNGSFGNYEVFARASTCGTFSMPLQKEALLDMIRTRCRDGT